MWPAGFGWTVADHDLADGRPQAVGADQRGAAILLAAFGAHRDAVGRLVDLDDFLRRIEADQIGFPAGLQQHLVQIGAMDERIGMMEFLAEGVAERNARDLLPGHRIHHDEVVGKDGERADRLDQAERLEHPEHIGPELDAGADLLELRRLFDELRGNTLARQRQRRRQPADAAADDEDLLIFPIAQFTCLRLKYCTFTYRPRREKSNSQRACCVPSPHRGPRFARYGRGQDEGVRTVEMNSESSEPPHPGPLPSGEREAQAAPSSRRF